VKGVAANGHDELFLIDGNSLAYRAFFALPESIATSTGFPTNTIFGFASMLVKLLTEYGPKPTIVVWDAGSSGRKEVSADYKATRRSRPDLLKEQWPSSPPSPIARATPACRSWSSPATATPFRSSTPSRA
jgi:DNA polymerase-1